MTRHLIVALLLTVATTSTARADEPACEVPCREEGRCTLDASSGECVASSEAACQASAACLELGYCHFYPGPSPSDPDSPFADPATRFAPPAHCGPADAAACAQSLACRNHGLCLLTEPGQGLRDTWHCAASQEGFGHL